ncbi:MULTISPECIES: DUF2207 family protein [unclassified Luteococcus]|uniref:DUF2207 family protein n=1 Tax=unclassified Luteococcus TaxID=2639923 RepID=UPI00313E4817
MIFRRGRDQEFVGVTPGQVPVDGTGSTRPVRGGREWKGEVAVQFHPPKDVSPALAGTVLDGQVNPADLGAMMIDLSLRGWFRIGKQGDDWELQLLRPIVASELTPAEVLLLQGLFLGQAEYVLLSQIKKQLAGPLRQCRDQLYQDVVAHGWYQRHPDPGRLATWWFGRSPRTAAGTAVRIQTLGFRKYLATAEADQIRFEEAADQFSRYLPYAMIFGLAERWAGVIGEVVRRAQFTDAAAVAAEFASDPMAWYLLDGMLDLAELGVASLDLADLVGEAGGLFDSLDGLGGLAEAFDGLSDFFGDFDLFDLFDF